MPLLVLLFIVVPIAELYVIIQVGGAIGVLPTIALLLADSMLGSLLLRSQGRAVWRRFNEALAEGRMPHAEVLDGVLVIFGGALLLTPGFITDVFGLVMIAPPTRAGLRRAIMAWMGRRFAAGRRVAMWTYRAASPPPRAAAPDPSSIAPPATKPYDVEGSGRELP